ncbi:hypothetical protein ABID56_002585 [Alkalibacillus flavidus]|uniref:SIR2-like domain-containing protein n=1 Tax=Alkalibacillus flavidus TaxID=546021 RepID=A0ABV2KXZ7_9BACI
MSYEQYKSEITIDIKECLNEMGTQPVLFVGSGLSKRYFNSPNWIELLQWLQNECSYIPHEVGYYLQGDYQLEEIGTEFSQYYRKWAWDGKERFPEELFHPYVEKSSYIKYKIKEYFESITPISEEEINNDIHKAEIKHLKAIQPHAIITTNYDTFLETIFNEYQPIIGQRVLKPDTMSIGEIFKIHGCVNEYKELVFDRDDYELFLNKKKYLSAKLLTFFAEHPLLFVGYSGSDENIQRILSDIDEIISSEGELIPNIYFLEFNNQLMEDSVPKKEKVFVINGKEVRVKYIEAKEFGWVFEAFSINKAIENVHPKLLRALFARTFQLVRSDIPRKSVEVDFQLIERAVSEESGLPNLYGVSLLDDPSQINMKYPFMLTQVGKELGYSNWHGADRLIKQIKSDQGINIKESDNKYHVTIKIGNSERSKYSIDAIELLRSVQKGENYTLDI